MTIKNAVFVKSSNRLGQCPDDGKPEFAFVGRSNVGKSSLINMLLGRKNLAKTSAKPGKTQLINHFLINERWYLVDLPGYGWAKVSKSKRDKFSGLVVEYVLGNKNLVNIFVLMDIRLEPQAIDIEFIEWLGEEEIPFSVVLTKSDKFSNNKINSHLHKYKKEISNYFEVLPPIFVTSSVNNSGKNDILEYIAEVYSSIA